MIDIDHSKNETSIPQPKTDSSSSSPSRMAVVVPDAHKERERSIEEQKEHGQYPLHDEQIGGG